MTLPTPKEIADELFNNAFLTEDQANTIAADVYQPLKEKIERIEKAINTLCSSCNLSVAITAAVHDDLYGEDENKPQPKPGH